MFHCPRVGWQIERHYMSLASPELIKDAMGPYRRMYWLSGSRSIASPAAPSSLEIVFRALESDRDSLISTSIYIDQ